MAFAQTIKEEATETSNERGLGGETGQSGVPAVSFDSATESVMLRNAPQSECASVTATGPSSGIGQHIVAVGLERDDESESEVDFISSQEENGNNGPLIASSGVLDSELTVESAAWV